MKMPTNTTLHFCVLKTFFLYFFYIFDRSFFIYIYYRKDQLNVKNSGIEKIKKLRLQRDSNPQPMWFEATEHLRNMMRKENCRKHL